MINFQKPIRPNLRQQNGIVLLEGLIAILIFSIGILAIMGLQAASINSARDAKYRIDAAFLANQIIGQMWADQDHLSSYQHLANGGSCSPSGTASSYTAATNWLNNDVAVILPSASSTKQQIIVNNTSKIVTVTVCWKAPQDSAYHSHTVMAQLHDNDD